MIFLGIALFGVTVVLTDGQMIHGEEVKRDGDVVVLVLKSGAKITLPAELVADTRTTEAAPTPPTVLAGEEVVPPTTKEQVEAIGSPSTWAGDPSKFTWAPESGFDLSKDVLLPGRSRFSTGPIDPTWKPKDGFKKEGTSWVGVPNGFSRFWGAARTPLPPPPGVTGWGRMPGE